MRFLLQRVTEGSVTWEGTSGSNISTGLVVFVGIGRGDQHSDIEYLVQKTLSLRIFYDQVQDKQVSIQDVNGELLVISQFTLYADTRKGRRPSFLSAESPDLAQELFAEVVRQFEASKLVVCAGKFGSNMTVRLSNDGPYTIMIDSAVD